MYLVQILLPLRDSKGRGFAPKSYDDVAHHLTEKFGGVTSFTRSPAEGRWKPGEDAAHEEDVVVFEVMVEDLEEKWWGQYRRALERAFKQKSVVVRAHQIRRL
jgi:hypothetical protein